MTIKREEEWGAVYPYAPDYVHPFTSREFAEQHARSTGSMLMKRAWVEVQIDAPHRREADGRGQAFDDWLAEHDRALIREAAEAIRRHCTPTHEQYTAGGDALIAAVADWVEDPPEWVSVSYRG